MPAFITKDRVTRERQYEAGERLELTDAEAARLLELGVIEAAPVESAPEEKPKGKTK
jgi:hypothetical protein